MTNFRLTKLTINDGLDIYNLLQQIPASENGFSNSFNGLNFEEYKKELEVRDNESAGTKLEDGRVPQTIFWFFVDDRPVGLLKLRHYLNDYLREHGGHIGYAISPQERSKGYASKMLELGLIEAKKLMINKVLITCNVDNIGSRKVIENNGGVLEKESEKSCYYWIEV